MPIKLYLPARKHIAGLPVVAAIMVLLFGLLGLAAPANSDDLATASLPAASGCCAPNVVHNFQKVSDGIWRGSAPSNAGLCELAKDGVKTIVDLRMDGPGVNSEKATAERLGINYYHFALGFHKPSPEKIYEILSVMTDPINQPVFIHCRQGADRTGMLCGIYRHVWEGWSLNRTYREMREHHFKPFLLTMRKQVKNADSDKSIIAVRTKHPALIAAVAPAENTSKPAAPNTQSTGDFSESTAPDTVPGRENPSSRNLLVARPHGNVN